MKKFLSFDYSLRAMFTIFYGILALTVLSLCVILFFGGIQTKKSVLRLQTASNEYETAVKLHEAVDHMKYSGAELSNSLSEESYNLFIQAGENADKVIADLPDDELKKYVVYGKSIIMEGSLDALDFYIVDDRKAGDEYMSKVRAAAEELEERSRQNSIIYEAMLRKERAQIISAYERLEKLVYIASAVAILICLGLCIVAWRMVFMPIQRFIDSISRAADDPVNSLDYKISSSSKNEIGHTTSALNSLYVAISEAISEAEMQANMAEESERRWQALFQESPDAIVLIDPETTEIIDRNPATLELLCMLENPEKLYTALEIHDHETEELNSFIKNVLDNGCARCDNLSCALESTFIPVSVVGIVVPHESGDAILLHIRDMSIQKNHEKELESARMLAVNANQAKTNFLANMSHEIRTPLNGVLGMAQGLQNAQLAQKESEMVDTIIDSGKVLTSILNDVLDLSKIEAGKLEIRPTQTDLQEAIEGAHKLFAQSAMAKDLEYELIFDDNMPDNIILDSVRIRQCFSNILSNAIKFTEQGSVSTHVRVTSSDEKGYSIEICVRDTGIGMPDEVLSKLFSPFMQGDDSKGRRFDGTGLGLTISRRLARLMGGDISVETKINEGSTFKLYFQVGLAKSDNEDLATNFSDKKIYNLAGKKVLLVDDNLINRQVVKVFLSPRNIESVEAENGKIAIALLEKHDFDLVLLDIHMPVMDGVETINHIRSCGASWSDIPVIALTADVMSGNKEKYVSMGMNDFLSKPIDQYKLLSALERAINASETECTAIRQQQSVDRSVA